jgi:hypothetical protein
MIELVILGVLLFLGMALLIESPIGRAFARRVEGRVDPTPPPLVELAKKMQLLEDEIDDLHRSVETLKEENQFMQKLLEEGGRRSALPPGPST